MLWFDLAAAAGRSVAEMQEAISAREFTYWLAYTKTRPLGPQWEDYRFGVLTAVAANQWRRKGDRPARPGDFYPSLRREEGGIWLHYPR